MASYKEAYEKSLQYFKGDELAAGVFVGKYALTDNDGDIKELTPDDMHRRLAKEFARIEKKYPNPMSEDEIYQLLKDFKYIVAQGSPMNAIGNDYQLQSSSNCFVVDYCEDSYGGILKSDQELVQLMKRRAGVGISLSKLRPKGVATRNASKFSDGIGIFMDRFSNTCREVAQGGRRGALMLCIDSKHPELETFINIKRNRTRVTGANISIKFDDEFMNAVKNGDDYALQWPVDSENPKVKTTKNAKELWKQVVRAAWESAEPGILFWDTVKKRTPSDIYKQHGFESIATNPCQPGWAKVLTKDGIKTFNEIAVGDFIWSNEGWTEVVKKWSTGVKKVFKYKTSSGVFYGTEEHRVVSNGEKIEVKNAEFIDVIRGVYSTDYKIDPQDVMDGLMIGDGSVHVASNNLVFLFIGENDKDYFKSEIKDFILEHRPGIRETAYEVQTTISHLELPKTFERKVPERFIKDKNKLVGFLRGLYSANGSVCGGRITLKAASLDIVEDVQMMLNSIGIKSYITTNKPSNVKFSNGEYLCKKSYDLNITSDRMKFKNLIGFIQEYKNDKIVQLNDSDKPEKKSYEIQEISLISEEEVFDITVANSSHTYWSQGCNVSNCGEINLSPLDSCRLLVLNLVSFVDNQFENESKFNFDKFFNYVIKAQRLMDDIIDLELEQIDKIIEKIKNDPEKDEIKRPELNMWVQIKKVCETGRRTGLGITALGDALAALNVRYGSDESVQMTEKIYKTLATGAYTSSIQLAKERGSFPIWNYDLEKDHEFIKQVIDELAPEVKETYKKYGRRNIALTTTAPTGSVSVMTQTTSGIEPAFLLKYTRRKKINPDSKDVQVDFVDELGDKWQEFTVYHHNFKKWMEVTGKTEIEDSPYYKATSNDVDWEKSVEIQAVAQKWVCHAISKTCNLPNDATEELVDKVYMKAWESGCKGFTVYRDGCRSGVLVGEKEKKEEEFTQTTAPKRSKELRCDIHQVSIMGEAWTILVGMYKDKPYEIFGGLSKFVHIPKKFKTGTIVKSNKKKNGRGIYELHYGEDVDDLTVIKNIADVFENPTNGAFTRTLSLALRHGAPIQYVVEQLQKDEAESDMYSFSKVIARVLKKYIADGTKSTDKNCESCGAENSVIYKEGCKTCVSCSHSKCG